MRSQLCLMPAKCVKCEALFDLRYDYSEEESIGEKEVDRKKNSTLMCWGCRANANKKR